MAIHANIAAAEMTKALATMRPGRVIPGLFCELGRASARPGEVMGTVYVDQTSGTKSRPIAGPDPSAHERPHAQPERTTRDPAIRHVGRALGRIRHVDRREAEKFSSGDATVDDELGAGDEAGLVAEQVGDYRGDLIGIGDDLAALATRVPPEG